MFEEKSNGFAFCLLKGVLYGVGFALATSLLFSLILSLFALPNAVVTPVTVVLKALSICFGVTVAVREEKGLLKGACIGVLIATLTAFAFGGVAGAISWKMLLELPFGAIVGAISGVLAVNTRRK